MPILYHIVHFSVLQIKTLFHVSLILSVSFWQNRGEGSFFTGDSLLCLFELRVFSCLRRRDVI